MAEHRSIQSISRAVKAIPTIVRPLVLLAVLPIGLHMALFRGESSVGTLRSAYAYRQSNRIDLDQDLPDNQQLATLIANSGKFAGLKPARCWRNADPNSESQPTAKVCRAMLSLDYIDSEAHLPTAAARADLGEHLRFDDPNIYVRVAKRQFRGIESVTKPPQESEALRDATRVDFTWNWRPINRVGVELNAGEPRNMRGSAYFVPWHGGTWDITQIEFDDRSPDYTQ